MNKVLSLVFGIAFAVTLSVFLGFFYTVHEGEKAIVFRLGQLQAKDKETNLSCIYKADAEINPLKGCYTEQVGPGLHFKWPFIDTIKKFDAKILMTSIPAQRISTIEKKDVMVNLFIKWRISDFGKFYVRHNNTMNAQEFLKRKAIDIIRAAFGERTIKEVVSGERKGIIEKLKKTTGDSVSDSGIEIIDLRIIRIDFPKEVKDAVFERMRSERAQDAAKLRAEGESKAEELRADADKQNRIIIATAKKEAELIRGEGDARAIEIYAQSYNQSPEFYDYYRSLETYRNVFNSKDDILILKPDSDFLKFFKDKKINNLK
ncbi:MAG: HflC protein [Francisellaceae bacterium]|nr:HflC protein [Francisellaceae bacterium]